MHEIDTRYGLLSIPDQGNDVIGRHLARYGEWAWDEVCFVASILPSKGVRVLDVGAFVGTFGLGLSQLLDLRSLCFVEANANVAPLLERNVFRIFGEKGEPPKADQKLRPIVLEAMVASPGTPSLPGHGSPTNLGGTSFLKGINDNEVITAPPPKQVVTLAELRAEYDDFDLVKLDVEGMELDILRSDEQALSKGDTTLWLECNENPSSLEIMNYLMSWNLDIYYFAFPAHNPDNIHHDLTPIFPFAYEAGLLVAPKRPPALDSILRSHGCILRLVASVQDLKDALWRTPRWGMKEWRNASPEETTALAGHALRGENYESYLQPGIWSPDTPVLNLKERIAAAEQLAQGRLSDLETERRRAKEAERVAQERLDALRIENQRAANAEALSAERLVALENERRRVVEAETSAAERLDALRTESRRTERAEALASERLNALKNEHRRAAEAETLAAERLNALEIEHQRTAKVEESLALTVARERDLGDQLEKSQKEGLECRNRVSALEGSFSWRITRPLRKYLGQDSWLRGERHGPRRSDETLPFPNIEERQAIEKILDVAYYLDQNPDVQAAGVDPVIHFSQYGWREGRNPSPSFDLKFYLKTNPDAEAAGINPVVHYVRIIASGNRIPPFLPNPEERQAIEKILDVDYYLDQNPDVKAAGVDPAKHFFQNGWREGRNPSPSFDVKYYLETNPDVAAAGINPVVHYVCTKANENPILPPLPNSEEREAIEKILDVDYYLDQNPDVKAAGADPVLHFFQSGCREGRNPSPFFDVKYYLETNPDVAAAGINPVVHYVRSGAKQDPIPYPLPNPEERQAIEKILDVAYYLAQNPDVIAASVDPIIHFFQNGWREGRNPSPFFDVKYYLETNPDVAAAGVNPVVHYFWSGASEGRIPQRPHDSWRKQLNAAVSPRKKIGAWAAGWAKEPLLPAGELENAVLSATNESGVMISFSHDDYLVHYGGIQNVIGHEQRAFNKEKWVYLHAAPADPLPLLSDETATTDFRISVRMDGKQLGIATIDELIEAVSALHMRNVAVECAVHHLLGFSPELLGIFFQKTGLKHPIFWTHDFFTICPNYNLMRNDVLFCGGPPADSEACKICCYGTERKRQLPRIGSFFENVTPRVLAPSQVALDLWKAASELRFQTVDVVPLVHLTRSTLGRRAHGDETRPLRVAFTGAQLFQKGWAVFSELARRHANDDRYIFFQLGQAEHALHSGIRLIPVTVNEENPNAMVEAVSNADIDVVINWSLWPETFCFTALEALAGGAFVVARAGSGNVWPVIRASAPDQGCSVHDETQLFALFQSGDILKRFKEANCRYGVLNWGQGTADWLLRSQE